MSQERSTAHGEDARDAKDAKDAEERGAHTAGAFDIRTFIAALIGIYGIVLVVTGIVQPDGRSINLTAGICMLLGAAAFFTWARLRPVVVPEAGDEGAGSGRPEH